MIKKVLSILLSLFLFLVFSINGLAAEFKKTTVSVDKTSVYETSSIKSDKLATVKEGYSFTPVGSTKSFWKIEFKKKNDKTIYTGYILKTDTNVLQKSENEKDAKLINTKPGEGWVSYGTSSLKALVRDIEKGYVIYYEGQYWASPEYAAKLKNAEVVYSHDAAPEEPVNRYEMSDW